MVILAFKKHLTMAFLIQSVLQHKHLAGGISCFDLVESEDIVPYRRPSQSISNSSLDNFFNTYNVDAGLNMSKYAKLF